MTTPKRIGHRAAGDRRLEHARVREQLVAPEAQLAGRDVADERCGAVTGDHLQRGAGDAARGGRRRRRLEDPVDVFGHALVSSLRTSALTAAAGARA